MKEKFNVTGMTCSACSSHVEKSVRKLDGVEAVTVNLLTGSMQVDFEEEKVSSKEIIEAVEHGGYGASLEQEKKDMHTVSEDSKPMANFDAAADRLKSQFIWSLIFLIPLMYISMGHMWGLPLPSFLSGHENAVSFAFTQFLFCIPIVYLNRNYYMKGFKTLFHLSPNMDSLIAVGSSAALIYGIFAIYRMSYGVGIQNMDLVMQYHEDLYFESGAMILTLITLGKFLEARSKGKTGEALNKLLNMAPKTAVLEKGEKHIQVPVEEVRTGDIVIIRPGSSIPVDGVVVEGRTSVDEAAITGESIPVSKEHGDEVIGATVNKSGFVKIKATKVGDDTTFSQIIRLVEEAGASKAPIAKLADQIAGVFVPVVMAIALVTGIVWILAGADFEFALSSAICVLVISCPCALGLATPVAIMVGTGKGAENGILIKSGEALEVAHSINSVILDKTGTITSGQPVVTDVIAVNMEKDALIEAAGSLEGKSEHPLADAILNYAKEQGVRSKEVSDFTAIPGKGICGVIDNKKLIAGNQRLFAEEKISLEGYESKIEELASAGKTPLLFAQDGKLAGIIAAADVVKPTSKEAISKLKSLGIEVIMLTGDNQRTAEGIGRELELDRIIADVLPQDKERVVSEIQKSGKKTAMVGDGINDAPALVRADVGIAIGAGTDVAVESADIVLMRSDLLDVVTAIRLSKAVIRNIKQNLFWAFFYNCLGIPLAAGVFYSMLQWRLSPMFGAAAMSFSSIFVVTNALRLKLFTAEGKKEETVEVIEQQEEQEEIKMVLKIEGMMCGHCVKHVQDALNAIEGVEAAVDLDKKEAVVTVTGEVSTDVLKKAVADAGYEVTDIQ